MNPKPGEIIAIFEFAKGRDKQQAVKSTILGGIYLEWLDYKGLFLSGATKDADNIALQITEDLCKSGEAKVIKSPGNLYHVWHICKCPDCARVGGKVWDHSQASWNEHLKHVANELIFTFPSANK